MATFQRLLKATFFKVICWLFILGAFSVSFKTYAASVPAVPMYAGCYIHTSQLPMTCADQVSVQNPWRTDITSAGQDSVNIRNAFGQTQSPKWDICTYTHMSGLTAFGTCTNGYVGSISGVQRKYVCPDGVTGTVEGDQCITEDPPPDACEENPSEWNGTAVIYTSSSFQETACYQGCVVNLGGGLSICTGDNRCSGSITTKTGASCSGGVTGLPPDDPEDDCLAQGKVYITYGGVTSCVSVGTAGSPPATKKETPPPVTQTETPPPTPENPNPEPVTTTTQPPTIVVTGGGSGAGSQPSVTEETTNADGSVSTVTKSKGQYCEEKPNAAICGDGQDRYFGGSCAAGFTCEGDAVMCSIAREQHKTRCDDFASVEQHQSAITKGQKLLDGEFDSDVQQFMDGTGNTTQVDLPDELSEQGLSLPAAGLTDLSVAFQSQTIVIPFSKLNRFLEMLGFIILACAYVSALRIVGVF